jgi:hypothetical protein
MPTECSADLLGFAPVDGREVVAAFDGGAITSDTGALLLGATDRVIRMTARFAACFDLPTEYFLNVLRKGSDPGLLGPYDLAAWNGNRRHPYRNAVGERPQVTEVRRGRSSYKA